MNIAKRLSLWPSLLLVLLTAGCHDKNGAVAVYSDNAPGFSESIYLKPGGQYFQTVTRHTSAPSFNPYDLHDSPPFDIPLRSTRKGTWRLVHCTEAGLLAGNVPPNAAVELRDALDRAPFQEQRGTQLIIETRTLPAREFHRIAPKP